MEPRHAWVVFVALLVVATASAVDLDDPRAVIGAHRTRAVITEQPRAGPGDDSVERGVITEQPRAGPGDGSGDLDGAVATAEPSEVDVPSGTFIDDGGSSEVDTDSEDDDAQWVRGFKRKRTRRISSELAQAMGRHRSLDALCPAILEEFSFVPERHEIACNACRLKYLFGTMESSGLTEAQRLANKEVAAAEMTRLNEKIIDTLSELEAMRLPDGKDPTAIITSLYTVLSSVGSSRSAEYRAGPRLFGWSPVAEGMHVCEQIGCCEPPAGRREDAVDKVRDILTKKGTKKIARVTSEWLADVAKESSRKSQGLWGGVLSKVGFGSSAAMADRCLLSDEGYFQYKASDDLTQITRDLTRPSFYVSFSINTAPETVMAEANRYQTIGQGLEYFFMCGGPVIFTPKPDESRVIVQTALKADMRGDVQRPSQYGRKLSEKDVHGEFDQEEDGVSIGDANTVPGDTHDNLDVAKGVTRDIHRFLSSVITMSTENIDALSESLEAAYGSHYEKYVEKAKPGEPAIIASTTPDFLAIHLMMMASQDLGNRITVSMAPVGLFAQGSPTAPYNIYQALNLSDLHSPRFDINIWFNVMDRLGKESMPLRLEYHNYLTPLEEDGVPIRIKWFPKMLSSDVRDQAQQVLDRIVANKQASCELLPRESSSSDDTSDSGASIEDGIAIPDDREELEDDRNEAGVDEALGGVASVTEAMDRAAVSTAKEMARPQSNDGDVEEVPPPPSDDDMGDNVRYPTVDLDNDDMIGDDDSGDTVAQ